MTLVTIRMTLCEDRPSLLARRFSSSALNSTYITRPLVVTLFALVAVPTHCSYVTMNFRSVFAMPFQQRSQSEQWHQKFVGTSLTLMFDLGMLVPSTRSGSPPPPDE